MKSFRNAFLFSLIVWAIPFITAVIIFPLREAERPLFESIISVVISIITVIMANLYLKNVEIKFFKEGIYIGLLWFVICIVIDLLLFMWGPMKMSFIDYMKDIGLTYIMIPAITIGIGCAEDIRFNKLIKGIPPAH